MPNTTVAGLFADIYEDPVARGQAVAAFVLVNASGPPVGPLISGFVSAHLGWRWAFWVGLTAAGVGLPFVWFLPETYTPVIAKKMQMNSEGDVPRPGVEGFFSEMEVALKRPWQMMFKEPILFLTALYLALLYSMQYLFFQSKPIVYGQIYGLSEDLVGLSYIPSTCYSPVLSELQALNNNSAVRSGLRVHFRTLLRTTIYNNRRDDGSKLVHRARVSSFTTCVHRRSMVRTLCLVKP